MSTDRHDLDELLALQRRAEILAALASLVAIASLALMVLKP